MSLFSFLNSILPMILLPCIFFFRPGFILLSFFIWLLLVVKLLYWDLCRISKHYYFGFWLFLLSELIIFVTLLFSCLWYQEIDNESLAYAYGVPLIETVLLVSSSFFMSCYHNTLHLKSSSVFLNMSLLFAVFFMIIAFMEIIGSSTSSLYNPHAACCFMVVGLHFSHVMIGTVLLMLLSQFGSVKLVNWGSDMFILYWHFVDYIWLFVYMVVYVLV